LEIQAFFFILFKIKVMTNKNPRFGICHNCLEKTSYKKMVAFPVTSKFGPDHDILICSPCNDKKQPKKQKPSK